MTKLLEAMVADVRTLPEDEQDRIARVLMVFLHDLQDCQLEGSVVSLNL